MAMYLGFKWLKWCILFNSKTQTEFYRNEEGSTNFRADQLNSAPQLPDHYALMGFLWIEQYMWWSQHRTEWQPNLGSLIKVMIQSTWCKLMMSLATAEKANGLVQHIHINQPRYHNVTVHFCHKVIGRRTVAYCWVEWGSMTECER